jgi:hypothetical protein
MNPALKTKIQSLIHQRRFNRFVGMSALGDPSPSTVEVMRQRIL